MPSLHWETKNEPEPVPLVLEVAAHIYPQGAGYPFVHPEDQLIWGDNLGVMAALSHREA